MTSTIASFLPVSRYEHLERFEVQHCGSEFSQRFWDDVDCEVQKELAALVVEARRKLPAVRVEAGSTMGAAFFLCSYRTFSIADGGVDPVVVAVTFAFAQPGVAVEADVSGEQSGDMIAAFPSKTVVSSREDVLAEARLSARRLCGTAGAVVAALQDASRRLE